MSRQLSAGAIAARADQIAMEPRTWVSIVDVAAAYEAVSRINALAKKLDARHQHGAAEVMRQAGAAAVAHFERIDAASGGMPEPTSPAEALAALRIIGERPT